MNKKIQNYLFVDEVEFKETGIHPLSLYYFGIEVPKKNIERIEKEIEQIILPFGKKGFHARDVYKTKENEAIINSLNQIILEHKLKIYCFPFVKSWLSREEFKILNDYRFKNWPEFKSNNYRVVSLILMLHVLNYRLEKIEKQRLSTRLIFDADWQNKNQGLVHEGTVLKKIENSYFTKQNKAVILALSDHIAYLFYCIKDNVTLENTKLIFDPINSKKKSIALNAIQNFIEIESKSLFINLDIFEWINYESNFAV